jgi:hypothetical protein
MNHQSCFTGFGLGLAVFALFCSPCGATEEQFDGYLMDRKCSTSVVDDPHPEDFIKHHTKDCCLMANCKKFGYTLFVKPRWLALDRNGNKLAIQLLEKSTRRSGFYVRIRGSVEGDRLKVKAIKEIEPVVRDEESVEAK